MTPYQQFAYGTLYNGDALEVLRTLPSASVQCCVTSPPYWGLRDYGVPGQIGMEDTPEEYVSNMVAVFAEVHRVLRDDGTLWLNLGDSYTSDSGKRKSFDATGFKQASNPASISAPGSRSVAGLPPKNLVGLPWRVAFALQAAGWYLRCDCIWHKPNPMPESVQDRPTRAHEYLFLLSKSERYFYDYEAVKEPSAGIPDVSRNRWDTKDYTVPGQRPQKRKSRNVRHGVDTRGGGQGNGVMTYPPSGRNRRSVWTVATMAFPGAHFATFPPALVEPCILAGSPMGGVVLDPFFGSGTVGEVARLYRRQWIGIELNPSYCALASRRVQSLPVVQSSTPDGPLLSLLEML